MRCQVDGCTGEALNVIDNLDVCDGCKAEILSEREYMDGIAGTTLESIVRCVPSYGEFDDE